MPPLIEESDREIVGPFILAGGMNIFADSMVIDDSESPFSLDFNHIGGRLLQRPGSAELSGFSTSIAPLIGDRANAWTGLFAQQYAFGSKILCFVSAIRFYTWDGSTAVDATNALITSASDTSPWELTSGIDNVLCAEGVVLAANGSNGIVYLDATGGIISTTLTLLTSHASYSGPAAPFAPRYITIFNGRLVCGYNSEAGTTYAQRTRASVVNSFVNFNTAQGAQVTDHADTPGEITGLNYHANDLLVLKSDAIIRGQETGNLRSPIAYPVRYATGCMANRSFQHISANRSIFLGPDNFYAFTGGEPEPIGDRIKRDLFKNLNYTRLRQIVGAVDKASNIYRCWIPTESSGLDYATRAYCYNWLEDRWWIEDWPIGITSYLYSPSLGTAVTIGSLSGTIGSYSNPIGDWAGSSDEPVSLLGTRYTSGDFRVFQFASSLTDQVSSPNYIIPEWQSKDFKLAPGKLSTIVSVVIYYSSEVDTTISVGISTDRGTVFSDVTQSALKGTNKYLVFNFEITGRTHRLRVLTSRQTESGGGATTTDYNPIEIHTAEVHFLPRGDSR